MVLLVVAGLFGDNEAVRLRSGSVQIGSNSAVVVRVNKPVLDTAIAHAMRLIGQHAKKVPLPDVKATVSGVDLDVTNACISHFDEPQLNYRLQAPNRIVGSLALPKFGLDAPFNATRRTFLKDQKDAGDLSFVANNVAVKFDAEIGQSETGMPNIGRFDCTAEMGAANVNVKNAKEKFAIEVIGLGAKMVRPIVTTQVCSTIKRLIMDEINRYLAMVPNVIALHKDCAVKYVVTPQVSEDHVQLGFNAKIITDQVNPDLPAKFIETPAPNAQVIVLLSDYFFNELSYHAHSKNKMRYTITKKIHPLVHGLLETDCNCEKAMCLGCVLPHVNETYGPNADVELTLSTLKAPKVQFINNKVTFTASIHADLAITKEGEKEAKHETASIEVTGSLQLRVAKLDQSKPGAPRLYARAGVENVAIHMNDQKNQKYEQQVHDYCKKTIETVINDFITRGLPLDLPFGFDFTEPQIIVKERTLQIHTGLKYEPASAPAQAALPAKS
jgi:hypothetical protein